MSRASEHAEDRASFADLHENAANTTEAPAGKGCLVAHDGRRRAGPEGKTYERSCNYRWQAFERALAESARYNWPKYKPLQAAQGAWDITAGGKNFRVSAKLPYWHEAHHVIPNGALRDTLACLAEGDRADLYKQLFRRGLLEEGFNLNHKRNMVLLPMDGSVAKVIGLPRHREDARTFHHNAYNNKVLGELRKILFVVKSAEQKHAEPPEYQKSKEQLSSLSDALRSWIYQVGAASGSLARASVADAESKD